MNFYSIFWKDYFSKRKNESEVTIISTLKSNYLFQGLSPKELRLVSKFVHIRNYESGENIFEQNEKGLGMYMITKGSVDIRITHPEQTNLQLQVTSLDEGSLFGEMALTDEEARRTASAYATSPTTLIGFFKPDLMEIMNRNPEIGVKIFYQLSKALGKRLTETTEALVHIAANSPTDENLLELKKAA